MDDKYLKDLTDALQQKIASEMNLSETVYIRTLPGCGDFKTTRVVAPGRRCRHRDEKETPGLSVIRRGSNSTAPMPQKKPNRWPRFDQLMPQPKTDHPSQKNSSSTYAPIRTIAGSSSVPLLLVSSSTTTKSDAVATLTANAGLFL